VGYRRRPVCELGFFRRSVSSGRRAVQYGLRSVCAWTDLGRTVERFDGIHVRFRRTVRNLRVRNRLILRRAVRELGQIRRRDVIYRGPVRDSKLARRRVREIERARSDVAIGGVERVLRPMILTVFPVRNHRLLFVRRVKLIRSVSLFTVVAYVRFPGFPLNQTRYKRVVIVITVNHRELTTRAHFPLPVAF